MKWYFLFVLTCLVASTAYSASEAPPKRPAAEKIICLLDKTKPKFVPNIYTCEANQVCCRNKGAAACCNTEIKKSAIREQALVWGALLAVLFVVGLGAYCYFNDFYCCDGEHEDKTICCCIPSSSSSKYKRPAVDVDRYLYPDKAAKNKVEDPIFGPNGRPEDVPAYATVDDETAARAKYI